MIKDAKKTQKKRVSPLSIRFSQKIKKRVDDISHAKKQSKAAFIQEAVEHYIDLYDWQVEGIKQAIKEVDEGKEIDGEIFLGD